MPSIPATESDDGRCVGATHNSIADLINKHMHVQIAFVEGDNSFASISALCKYVLKSNELSNRMKIYMYIVYV